MRISISDDLTEGFKSVEVPFVSLYKYTKKYCYSASEFSSTHRHKDNIKNFGRCIIFDFDEGVITLHQMKLFLKNNNVTSLIVTTKSHQKEKNGKAACDRFRVFIPFDKELAIDISDYADFYMFVANVLKIGDVIDTACKNPSRSYYPNINQKEIYVDTGKVFNAEFFIDRFRKYNLEAKKKKQEAEKKKIIEECIKTDFRGNNKQEEKESNKKSNGPRKIKKNELPRDFSVNLGGGNTRRFDEFEYLGVGETVPCRCANPYHTDNNPSAFVSRSKNTNNLMIKCSSCGALYFIQEKE